MARNRKSAKRGEFELLEQRQLLAGDVVLNVLRGELMVQGDTLDNKIVIASGAEAGTFVVTGVDGTTVHIQGEAAAGTATVTGVRSIEADLGEGNDLVAVVGANVRGYLTIDTGAGNDRVRVGAGGGDAELTGVLPADLAVSVRLGLRVDTGAGEDQISIDDASIYGRVGVEAGTENDSVALGSMAATAVAVGPDLGGGQARLRVHGVVYVDLGAGNDTLNMDKVAARYITAEGGSEDDTINARMTYSSALAILGDGGVDRVTLAGVRGHYLGIHTGDGDDVVDARDSAFATIGVALGNGNDTLTTAGLKANLAVLLGGDGEDTYDNVSANDFKMEIIHGFEIPPDINTPPPFRRPGVLRPIGRF